MEVRELNAKYFSSALRETEVGPIPLDWSIVSLDEITDSERPISYGIVQTGPRIQNGVPCIRVVDIQDGKIRHNDLITTSEEISSAYRRTKLREGDLVVPLRGKVGECAQVAGSLAGANLTRGVALVAVLPKYSTAYCKQFFSSSRSRARLNGSMNGSALQEVPIATLRSFKIALPLTVDEQNAIAKALADADALIDSLEQLLVKKRQIKQGAMQELLTGKRRLLQEAEAWRQIPLGDVGRWSGGMTPSMARPDYWSPADVPWLSSGDLKTARLSESAKCISKVAVRDGATTLVPAKSVVVVMRSGILRKYFPVGMTLKPMAINQDLKAIQPNNEVAADFLLHALMYWGERILATCLKSGTTVESIEFRWLKAFTIDLPTLPEQEVIASVLSDMDTEITAIESSLTKARALKQAMAQALLTGRIRLVEPTA